MDYTEDFDNYDYEMVGGKNHKRSRKRRSNSGKSRGKYRVRSASGKLRKRRSNSGKSRGKYRVRSASGKLRKRRSKIGKKRK